MAAAVAPTVTIDPPPGGILRDSRNHTFTATLVGGSYDRLQYAWRISSGAGTINASTGVFRPNTVSSDTQITVRLTVVAYGDGGNADANTVVTTDAPDIVVTLRHFGAAAAPAISINAPAQINEDQTLQLTITKTGGNYDVESESWEIVSGGGTITVGGLYRPANVLLRDEVTVRVTLTVLGDGTTVMDNTSATAVATASFTVLAVAGGDSVLQIGTVDAAAQLLAESLNVTQDLRGVSTASFTLETETVPGRTLVTPEEGQQVAVAQDGQRTFLGELRDVAIDTEDVHFITWACRAVDYRAVLNDRYVSIETTTVSRIPDVVLLLQSAVLNSEGILVAAGLPSGTNLIPATKWGRRSVTSILDEIMEVEDWVWRVNTNKQLIYGPYGQVSAPHTLTDADLLAGQHVHVEKTKDDYANQVTFIGGRSVSRTTVGGQVISEIGEEIVVTVKDQTEIDRRAAIEGGSGIHEKQYEDLTVVSASTARARALGILNRRKRIAQIISFSTDRAGYQIGQSLTVRVSKPQVSGSYLIERIGIRTLNPATGKARYTIRARSSGVLENLGTYIAGLKKK